MPTNEAFEVSAHPRHILLLEDEWLIAFDLQEALERAGYIVVGPAPSVGVALDIIQAGRLLIDAGLLDLHVGRETSYPVADALRSRGIPFAFLTGHSREDLEPDFRSQAIVCKPASSEDLVARLEALLASG